MHITKFRKHPDKDQAYLKTVGITVSDKSKLQFYVKQMLDSRLFDKRNIISWEDRKKGNTIWPNATKYFQDLVDSNERHTNVASGTAKSSRFNSAVQTYEYDNYKTNDNKKL